ncbi:MAG: MerR family transcriptional regulator [Deltaproteobacteria bacterium]|nr:MerR family transcriptional regulator [Deltaproteobacteria bacterium]
MARKYLRIAEVIEICGVDEEFILRLEQENVIYPIIRRRRKLYPLDQVDRVRVAHLLIEEMGVNVEGAEVTLHMREQMIAITPRRRAEDFQRTSDKGRSDPRPI